MRVDPLAVGELLKQGAVETARSAVIDVFDNGMLAQPGKAQACPQSPVIALGCLPIEQQAEPFGVRQLGALRICLQFGEGAGHAGEPDLVELVDCRMGQQATPP